MREVFRDESRADGPVKDDPLSVPRMEETSGKALWRQEVSVIICLRDFPPKALSSRPYLIGEKDETRKIWVKLSGGRVSLWEMP